MIWLCSITLEVNPKDLNKNKGLKLSPLFLFIYWSYLYVSTCAIPLFRMAQEVKYSLFMGESAQVAYPNRAPKKFVTFWEEEERRQPQRAKRVLCCKAVLTSQRLCLTCSTLWALRTTWSCLIILADKSTKIKRLRLSRETIIQLDALIAARRIKIHAHLRARVFIMYGVFGIHFLASTTSSFPMSARSSRWGRNSRVSLTSFAWFSNFRLPLPSLSNHSAPNQRNICFTDAPTLP